MRDLYFDDIEAKDYTDKMILDDVRALVRSGQREGSVLDYKSDISPKDNWPETVGAFANTFGGLIVFGVEGKGDQPRSMAGFDPKGREIKTQLSNTIIDRIQPRPDFLVRVVRHDQDSKKEIAVLRVAEGRIPPYMHSKGNEHRIYIRAGAQKAEADYLQLLSLFEKRKITRKRSSGGIGPFERPLLMGIPRPIGSGRLSPDFLRFSLSPQTFGESIRLNFEAERQFRRCVDAIVGSGSADTPAIRSQDMTIFPIARGAYQEQRFALADRRLEFVSYPGVTTNEGLFFIPRDFCEYLMDFVSISSLFYERTIKFFGSGILRVSLAMPSGARLFQGQPQRESRLGGSSLFDPPLLSMGVSIVTDQEISLSPLTVPRMLDYLEAVMTSIARASGSVLVPEFNAIMQELVAGTLKKLGSARAG